MDGLQPQHVRTLIRWLKDGPPGAIPISGDRLSQGSLQAVTWEDAGDRHLLECLGRWHESAFAVFAFPVTVSFSGARRWLTEQVLEIPERLLFWIRDVSGQPIGHIGLSRFDFTDRTVALRDIVCGESGSEVLVAQAVETLSQWVRETLQMQAVDARQSLAA